MAAWELLLSTTFPGQLGPVIFFFFWLRHRACGILISQPGIEPTARFGSSEVLTTGLPGKSQSYCFDSSDPARDSWTSLDSEACPGVHLGTQAH